MVALKFYFLCFFFSSISAIAMFLRMHDTWATKHIFAWFLLSGCQGCILVAFTFGDPIKMSNVYYAFASAATVGLLQPWFKHILVSFANRVGLKTNGHVLKDEEKKDDEPK